MTQGWSGATWFGNKIQDQPQPAFTEQASCGGEPRGAAEVLIDDVAAHAVGRPHIVFRRKVGEGSPEILEEPRVSHGDLNSGRAPLPDPHEPDGVKAQGGNGIPLRLRYRAEIYWSLVFPAEFTQPHPGIDLVNDRIFGPGFHLLTSPASEAPFANAASLPPSSARSGVRRP